MMTRLSFSRTTAGITLMHSGQTLAVLRGRPRGAWNSFMTRAGIFCSFFRASANGGLGRATISMVHNPPVAPGATEWASRDGGSHGIGRYNPIGSVEYPHPLLAVRLSWNRTSRTVEESDGGEAERESGEAQDVAPARPECDESGPPVHRTGPVPGPGAVPPEGFRDPLPDPVPRPPFGPPVSGRSRPFPHGPWPVPDHPTGGRGARAGGAV